MRRAHLIFFPITGDKLTIDHAILEKYIIIIIIILFTARMYCTVVLLFKVYHYSHIYIAPATPTCNKRDI